MNNLNNHYTFIHLIDVNMGNPNGDPALDNQPRMINNDFGLITNNSIKRKIRDTIYSEHGDEEGYDLFVFNDTSLTEKVKDQTETGGNKKDKNVSRNTRNKMLDKYFDIRMFGSMMNFAEYKAGCVTGCLQLSDYKSYDPVQPHEIQVSRIAITTDKDFEAGKESTFGNKYIIPYALYSGMGVYNPKLAAENNVKETDLKYFWETFNLMFDRHMSFGRGIMCSQKLFVFEQEGSPYYQAGKLAPIIKVSKKADVINPASFADYDILVDYNSIPEGVKLHEVI